MSHPPAAPFPAIVVRRLHVDMAAGFPRRWNGDDVFFQTFCNAMSLTFPAGEQFFIEATREACKYLPDTPQNAALQTTVREFIGQEATHRRVHELYNAELERQGYVNRIGPRLADRIASARVGLFKNAKKAYLHELAVTNAYEHITAVLAFIVLDKIDKEGDWFANATPMMQTVWRWHAAEEWEHKAVTFDVYVALGGSNTWRQRWYTYVLWQFAIDVIRQMVRNLWHDRELHKPKTWVYAWRFLFGKHGIVQAARAKLKEYRRPDFHPMQGDVPHLAADWLASHPEVWSPVREPKPTAAPAPATEPMPQPSPMSAPVSASVRNPNPVIP